MSTHSNSGMTLLEVICVLGLVIILLSLGAIPAYQSWINQVNLGLKARRLLANLKFARNLAIQQHMTVAVCPSSDTFTCQNDWKKDWITLSGIDQSRPRIVRIEKGVLPNQVLSWHGARGVKFIQFNTLGSSHGYNGRFVLCAKNSKVAWFIFVSPTGRARLETSKDLSQCTF